MHQQENNMCLVSKVKTLGPWPAQVAKCSSAKVYSGLQNVKKMMMMLNNRDMQISSLRSIEKV